MKRLYPEELPELVQRRQRKLHRRLLLAIVAVAAYLVAVVHNAVTLEERLRAIQVLERACDSLEGVRARLRQQLAREQAPERIIPLALELGLVLPEHPPQAVP
jgi:tellurite resistance protein